jgi:asparagine synthase (glutamine-hydrolysing)
MCGISAILRLEGGAVADLADLDRMHRAQQHRGPDGEGAFVIDRQFAGTRYERVPSPGDLQSTELRVVAALRRLRISDPRPVADQPLVSADRRCWVVLNGAIYNFRELAAELTAAGHSFHTGSDTEVVMEAYRRWGPSCFEKFNGMWAILIVDLDRKVVVGSRDRIGIKPFYYALDGKRLLFASEPWAIAQVQTGGPAIGTPRFFEFLSGYPPQSAALSFFRGVHPVPAGTWFEIDLRSSGPLSVPRFQPYWKLADYRCNGAPALSFPEAAERFRELLKTSVAGQSIADVKVGSLLSGGFDSPTIVMLWSELAAARGSQRPDTLSIAWDNPDMSERANIEAIAAKAGSDSHILELSARDVWMTVDDVIKAQGQPLLGQELIAQYHVYRLAREQGDTVVMDGNGLDEVQAGLPYYETEMVLERFLKLQLIDVARELHCIARNYGRSYYNVLLSYLVAPLRRHLREGRVLPTFPWLDQRACDTTDPDWISGRNRESGHDPSLLNRMLYRETRHTNVPAVLMYSDRNSMAHSVEARFPYLDHRIVELCFSLPASYKVGFGQRKRLLFETAKRYLPTSVIESKKKKQFVMMNNWMPLRGEHAATIRDASRSPAWEKLPYVDAPKLHAFVDDYLAGRHENGYAVWRVFTASRWLDLFKL